MHDRFVGLLLEVVFPPLLESFRWPRLHLLYFLFGRTDFDTGLDAVRSQWTSAIHVPLVKDPLLSLGIAFELLAWKLTATMMKFLTSEKFVKGLGFWLGPILHKQSKARTLQAVETTYGCKCQIVVLKVQANTRKIDNWLHSSFLKLFRVAYFIQQVALDA